MTITFNEATGGPVPKIEIEINLRSTGGLPATSTYRDVYVLAERVAAGTLAANTVTSEPFSDVNDAIAQFGAASAGANMCAHIFNHREPSTGKLKGDLYGAAVAESAGVAATQTLTFAAGPATSSGTWIFSVGGHRFSVPVAVGDAIADMADNTADAYDALAEWERPPVTCASNGVDTVTFTASGKGLHWNTIGTETIQDPNCAITDAWGAATMTGGTLYPTLTTVLAALLPVRTPILVVPWEDFTDTTGLIELLIDHVVTKSNATNMLGSTLISADIDTSGNLGIASALTDDGDSQRYCFVGVNDSGTWSGEIAAKFAAAYGSQSHLARSANGLQLVGVDTPSVSNNFTETQQRTLINAGVTPLAVPQGGNTLRIVRAVANRTDLGYIDFALMTVMDYVRDSLSAKLSAMFSRASIIPDANELPDAEHVTQPKFVRAAAKAVLLELEQDGYLTGVDDHWEDVSDELDGSTYSMAIPVEMVPQWHNTLIRIDQEVS